MAVPPSPQSAGPSPTRFDLRGSLFGTPIRIHPLFWLAVLSLGWPFYADPDRGSFTFFLLWVFCVLLSLLIHEAGHVAVARLFGARLEITLYGLGSYTFGIEALDRRIQRLAVRLGGPLAQLLFFAGLLAIPPETVRSWFQGNVWADALVGRTVEYLIFINVVWPLLNLLPVWPLDGGLIAQDLCRGLFGNRGTAVALGVCLAVSAALILIVADQIKALWPLRFDPRGTVKLQAFIVLLAFCAFFLVSAFRALGAEYRQLRGQAASRR